MWFKKRTPAIVPLPLSQVVADLFSDFEHSRALILSTASASALGGDDRWLTVVESYGVTPLTASDKTKQLATGVTLRQGALPVEVRAVLLAWAEQFQDKSTLLAAQYESELHENEMVADQLWNFQHRTLPDCVKKTLTEYLQKVQTSNQAAGLDDIFTRAKASEHKYSKNLKTASVYVVTCQQCGAARQATDQYTHCRYCGSALFTQS